jgi:ketosteroid isomerase-like protein
MTDLNEVAKELEAAFAAGAYHEALIPHLAETIEVHHHPTPGPGDGPSPGAGMAAMMRGDPFAPVLTKLHREAKSVSVDGDTLVVDMTMIGTAEDGSEVRVPLLQRFGFADGRIVSLDHFTDPAITDPIMKAVHAARTAAAAG